MTCVLVRHFYDVTSANQPHVYLFAIDGWVPTMAIWRFIFTVRRCKFYRPILCASCWSNLHTASVVNSESVWSRCTVIECVKGFCTGNLSAFILRISLMDSCA